MIGLQKPAREHCRSIHGMVAGCILLAAAKHLCFGCCPVPSAQAAAAADIMPHRLSSPHSCRAETIACATAWPTSLAFTMKTIAPQPLMQKPVSYLLLLVPADGRLPSWWCAFAAASTYITNSSRRLWNCLLK
jgi:hypothetical protein